MVDLAGAVRLAGIPQGSLEWLSEWDLRITGSKCYSLYTYAKGVNPDWQRKMASLDKARGFVGSVATKYGQKHEKVALELYKQHVKEQVFQRGLLVPP